MVFCFISSSWQRHMWTLYVSYFINPQNWDVWLLGSPFYRWRNLKTRKINYPKVPQIISNWTRIWNLVSMVYYSTLLKTTTFWLHSKASNFIQLACIILGESDVSISFYGILKINLKRITKIWGPQTWKYNTGFTFPKMLEGKANFLSIDI